MVTMDGVPGQPGSRTRAACDVSDEKSWSRFLVRKATYAPQYAQLYFNRLTALRPRVRAAAERAWLQQPGAPHFADRILAAAGTAGDAALVGVVYRDLPDKPSILAEYGKTSDQFIPAPPARTLAAYTKDSDAGLVSMEDETGRLTLDVSDVRDEFDRLATGVVVAVRGKEDRSGEFRVSGVVSAGLAPQQLLSDLAADRYVCIVSGLGLGNPSLSPLPSELLLEYLRANIGDEEEEAFSASIVHLIIAGNTVASPAAASRSSAAMSALSKPHLPVDKAAALDFAAPMVLSDRFLTAAAAAMPVSVMPGEHDPVNCLLPQQPMHRCLLPNASREANLQRVTNPYECSLDGRCFLGTSGQNVHDYVLYNTSSAKAVADAVERCQAATVSRRKRGSAKATNGNGEACDDDKMDVEPPRTQSPVPLKQDNSDNPSSSSIALGVLETMMKNRHIVPTAPDTLGAYPFYDSDPFVVEKTPHVFFCGNQPEFGARTVKGSAKASTSNAKDEGAADSVTKLCLVSVPRFDMTGTIVLVNLRTLACTTVHFNDTVA